MRQKAAVTDGLGHFAIGGTVIEGCGREEVLVKEEAAMLGCTEHDSLRWDKQNIIGHEGAGQVEEDGMDTIGATPGDMWHLKQDKHYLNLLHAGYRPQTGFPEIKHFEDCEVQPVNMITGIF